MENREKEKKVYDVFQEICEGYDSANLRISLGMEKRWKKELAELFKNGSGPKSFLDVCCGTGDMAIAIKHSFPSCAVTAIDFSPAMLAVAKKKAAAGIDWLEGNAMALPFDDGSFDGACISFGLRNTPDYLQVLSEMRRVVRKDGMVACLDSFVPESRFISFFYNIYFKRLMPLIGGRRVHREEYRWLADSTELFLRPTELKALFEAVGLRSVKLRKMMFGACCLHWGIK